MASFREKRKRRQAKLALKFGKKAKPSHKRLGGRTGASMAKKVPSKKPLGLVARWGNPPPLSALSFRVCK